MGVVQDYSVWLLVMPKISRYSYGYHYYMHIERLIKIRDHCIKEKQTWVITTVYISKKNADEMTCIETVELGILHMEYTKKIETRFDFFIYWR